MNEAGIDSDASVVEDSAEPDYSAVDVPAKPPTEYHWTERRAELLQLIKQVGHPRAVNQTELAERYGVSQQQISKDLDKLSAHVDETLGDRRALITEAVYHTSIKGLLDEQEYRKAAQTVKDWNEWLDAHKELQELQEDVEEIKQQLAQSGPFEV